MGARDMSLLKSVEIPAGTFVECPLVRFDMVPLSGCPNCPKFGGLEDRFPSPEGKTPFHRRYLLRCFGEPVKRQIRAVAEG